MKRSRGEERGTGRGLVNQLESPCPWQDVYVHKQQNSRNHSDEFKVCRSLTVSPKEDSYPL